MAKMGKLDRMGVAESKLSEAGAEDIKEIVEEISNALETFEEQRAAAEEAFAEAVNYHDERDWESRDSSLEEAATAVEEMSEALETIDASAYVNVPEERLEEWRDTISEVREHLGLLI